MARSIQSRAPAPPGALGAQATGAVADPPLGGARAEAIRRLQMGAVGVVAVLLLIGLASIIKDRATQTESTAVAEAAATTAPSASSPAADPLAEAGVVPDMPSSSPDIAATGAATVAPPRAPASPAIAPQDAR